MADKSKIEWTDATWPVVTGCNKVSAGCKHCYAERDWSRLSANPKTVYHGRSFTDVACHPERLDWPLRWTKPRMIFVPSMGDLFHEDVPDEFIDRVFAVMALCPQHTFQVLTKRPERMHAYLHDLHPESRRVIAIRSATAPFLAFATDKTSPYSFPLPNVWLGVTVENQEAADERIPLLLRTPAAVRFLSCEPLLGRVDLCETFGMWWNSTMQCFEATGGQFNQGAGMGGIDWVIVGGESGWHARPMHPDWVRSLRNQCQAASVPFFFKQHGEWLPEADAYEVLDSMHGIPGEFTGGLFMRRVGKKHAGRLLDGRTWEEIPSGSMNREYVRGRDNG